MKKKLLAGLAVGVMMSGILLGFFVPPANANLINIISEAHSIYGFTDSGDHYSYTTDSSPSISGEILDGRNNITSGAGNFNDFDSAYAPMIIVAPYMG